VTVAVAGMAVLGMTATLAGAEAHPATYARNDVMQAPFASDMVAAPTGAAVAWVFNAKGCSNIWVADPSHGAKPRQITPYTEDDGFDIGELAWSPDAKSIAFTRGQSLEDETPTNVNTSPEGAMPREVWVVATAGGAPSNDGVVPSQQAAELIEGLRSHNIDHDVIMIPNEIHDMARYSSWMMLFNAADVYFDRHLNKRSASSP
jgi:dipeptidyl aminopeptidase/acylaminoacyl peptidase